MDKKTSDEIQDTDGIQLRNQKEKMTINIREQHCPVADTDYCRTMCHEHCLSTYKENERKNK